jgi:hypothetical protein
MMGGMIHRLGRRLSLFFDRPSPGAGDGSVQDGHPGAAVLHPIVDFMAFAEDCVLSGRIRLRAERLTDMLNEHEELLLVDVMAQPLREPDIVEVTEVLVRRDELLLVNATGPRGDQARRTRTRPTFVAIHLGPYKVRGNLHESPGLDAVAGIRRRHPMVPLTDAWVDYPFGGRPIRQRLGTAIVNRDRIDFIVQSLEHDVDVPDLAMEPLAEPGLVGPDRGLVAAVRGDSQGP